MPFFFPHSDLGKLNMGTYLCILSATPNPGFDTVKIKILFIQLLLSRSLISGCQVVDCYAHITWAHTLIILEIGFT